MLRVGLTFCLVFFYHIIYANTNSLYKLSFNFEENLGQIKYPDDKPAPEVKFMHQQGNLKIFLLKTGLAYQLENYLTPTLSKGEGEDLYQLPEVNPDSYRDSGSFYKVETYRMDMELLGANPNPEIIAEGKSNDYTNYYQPDLIQTHNYQKITYKNIYPGIDWVVYISAKPQTNSLSSGEGLGEVKYDFIVHPSADPSLIQLKYTYTEQLFLDNKGNLILRNRLGDILENAPIAFQEQKDILVKYRLNDSVLSFELKDYQKDKILVIDPKLEWSTYYGGTQAEVNIGTEVDSNNNVY
ncbi:MAG: hypothetical protein ACK58Q_12830, partial [Chitinophagales bacterium]